jgi:dephospho-CoA kinase
LAFVPASENVLTGMKTFGLTGGVGMGKSTAADILRGFSVPVVDTDELARRFVEPGEAALAEIQAAFGNEIVAPDGRLRRGELARIIFADSAARQKLEGILHPRIRAAWLAQVESWRKDGRPLAVVVIPLLFETRAETFFEKIICVACATPTQQQRLQARGWNADQIQQRLAAQWPVTVKIARADFLVWTEGSLDIHRQQWQQILKKSDFRVRSMATLR